MHKMYLWLCDIAFKNTITKHTFLKHNNRATTLLKADPFIKIMKQVLHNKDCIIAKAYPSNINFSTDAGYTRRMLAYDAKTNRFTVCANLKERKMHHSAIVLNNKLYITGGRYLTGQDDVEDSNSFEVYDSLTDSWTSAGSLPHKLFDHGSVTLTCVSETRAKQN